MFSQTSADCNKGLEIDRGPAPDDSGSRTTHNKGVRVTGRLLVGLLMLGASALAQGTLRRATNLAALTAFPAFFQGRQILVVGDVSTSSDGRMSVSDGAHSIRLVSPGSVRDGSNEVRGEFWDLGRMHADDPRLVHLDLLKTFGMDPVAPWPKSGEVTAIAVVRASAASVPPSPTIRTIVLNPSRYLNQTVTVTGQFGGRNLNGDLPDAPARSRWDFVIRTSDAAIWVCGARPKGKDFDLGLDARIDTGRWLEVTGVVHEGHGLQWLDVGTDAMRLTRAPTESAPVEEAPVVQLPSAPPPEVVFSAPTEGETDVPLSTSVRIQFSRDIAQATLKGHIHAAYVESETVEKGEPTTPTAPFTANYHGANRVLELKFTHLPLERFRTLRIELDGGIMGTDDQPLKPWTLTFILGGA
jgi:hypothetical protein